MKPVSRTLRDSSPRSCPSGSRSSSIRPDSGQTVTRTLSVVRIRKWDSETTDILLGCTLSRPITEEEAVALDLALPFHGESMSDAQERLSLGKRLHTGTPIDDDA